MLSIITDIDRAVKAIILGDHEYFIFNGLLFTRDIKFSVCQMIAKSTKKEAANAPIPINISMMHVLPQLRKFHMLF